MTQESSTISLETDFEHGQARFLWIGLVDSLREMAVVTGRMNEDLSRKIDAIARAMESGEQVDDFLHNLSGVKLRTKQAGESGHDSRT